MKSVSDLLWAVEEEDLNRGPSVSITANCGNGCCCFSGSDTSMTSFCAR